jgi:hypothetical protein
MDRKMKTGEPASSINPYEEYWETQAWKIVDIAIGELVENNDLVERTRRTTSLDISVRSCRGAWKHGVNHSYGSRSNDDA